MQEQEIMDYFAAALESERGIRVLTDEPQRAISKFHEVRRKSGTDLFDSLVVAKSRTAPESEIWIVRQDKESANGPQVGTAPDED